MTAAGGGLPFTQQAMDLTSTVQIGRVCCCCVAGPFLAYLEPGAAHAAAQSGQFPVGPLWLAGPSGHGQVDAGGLAQAGES